MPRAASQPNLSMSIALLVYHLLASANLLRGFKKQLMTLRQCLSVVSKSRIHGGCWDLQSLLACQTIQHKKCAKFYLHVLCRNAVVKVSLQLLGPCEMPLQHVASGIPAIGLPGNAHLTQLRVACSSCCDGAMIGFCLGLQSCTSIVSSSQSKKPHSFSLLSCKLAKDASLSFITASYLQNKKHAYIQ